MTEVVLGVGGGIAAYKACELLRLFTESGHGVRVVPTASALQFVGAPTWAALSGRPGRHRGLGRRARGAARADRPAGRPGRRRAGHRRPAGQGRPRARRRPAHQHPAHRDAARSSSPRRCTPRCGRTRPPGPTWRPCGPAATIVIEPAVGRLTGADTGKGRLPDPAADLRAGAAGAAPRRRRRADLAGRHVVVTAGGTREPLDPVRFLGNRSSGKQGYALARAAVARGARVTLIAANVTLTDPAGADVVRVGTTEELRNGHPRRPPADADVVVMAAAPADFRPGHGRRPEDQESPTTVRRPRSSSSPTRTSPPSWAPRSAPVRCWSPSPRRPTTPWRTPGSS